MLFQKDKKLIRRRDSEQEFFTTPYTYYKIRQLRFNLSESVQNFHHGKMRDADEFENNSEQVIL